MKKRHPQKNKILLVNITRLGDMLQATPTIAGMKLENPGCKITVLVEKQFEEVCYSLPHIDKVMSIDLGMTVRSLAREADGIIDAYEYLTELVDELRAEDFDYCLNMSSSAYTALLLKLVGIERNGGWVSDDEGNRVIESEWARLFATSVFHQNRQYNSLNLVDIFRCSADVEAHPRTLGFNLSIETEQFARNILNQAGFTNTGPLVAVQAGASQGKRQWSTDRFVALVRCLLERHNARVLMVGTKKELSIIDPIKAACSDRNVYVAAGLTSIPQLAALLKNSDVLITGDTGPMHIAASVGTPTVSMFLASAFSFETGPYGDGHIILQPVISCGPCNPNKQCARTECHELIDPQGLADLAIARVREDFKVLPADLRPKFDNTSVVIYRSCFDRWGFYDLAILNNAPIDPLKSYRDAYRKLWLEELAGYPQGQNKPRTTFPVVRKEFVGLEDVVRCAERGQALIKELIALVGDRSAPAQALGEVGEKLTELDREIEQIGLQHSPLGPITRMFIFAKENLVGSDVASLASQMGRAYEDLARRSRKLGQYFQEVI